MELFQDIGVFLLFGFIFFVIFKLLKNLIPNFYIPKLLFGYYVFQFCILNILNIINRVNNLLLNNYFTIRFNEMILPYGGIVLLIGCIFLAYFFFLKHFLSANSKLLSLDERLENIEHSDNHNKLLIFLGLVFSLNIFSAFNLNYILQAISLAFSFSPVIFGLLYKSAAKKTKYLWLIILSITFIIHIIQGSRGYAILPLIFFLIGYIIQLDNNKKRLSLLVIFLIIAFPFLSFFGKISDFRSIYGRGLNVSIENLSKLTDFVFDSNNIKIVESSSNNGLNRLLNQPDIAVIKLTPEKIPFRSSNYIFEELKNMISLQGSSDKLSSSFHRKYGNSVAINYGYTVSKTTSVEFSLLADSYSRAGIFGVIIYYSFLVLLLFCLEVMTASSLIKNSFIALILFIFIVVESINGLYAYTIWAFLKNIIFRGTFILLIMYAFSHKLRLKI